MLTPKLWTLLKEGIPRARLLSDVSAGLIVGVVALPLAIAFAIASGVSPERGLMTAIIGGFVVSAFGGSRVQIGGPTGAFVVIVYGVVAEHGVEGLMLATMMAGVLLIVMGLARFGSAIKFMPYPVVVGFTSGIALIIFTTQMRDFFGLQTGPLPGDMLEMWGVYAEHWASVNPYAVLVGGGTLVVIVALRRWMPRVPGALVGLLAASVTVHMFGWPVETIGDRFAAIPQHVPKPVMPSISWDALRALSSPALTIALLAGIEALLSAVVADGMIGGRHRSNMELVAQGLANVASPLFGGIPVTGAIARTATNIQAGGRTPVAGIVHALTLLIIMLFLGQWVSLIPLAALAGILVYVAYNMSEYRSFLMVLKSPRGDALVLVITFVLTVVIDLTAAIQTGVVLACFLFMRRMSLVSHVDVLSREFKDSDNGEEADAYAISGREVPEGVEVYEINGPFFFGASFKFHEAVQEAGQRPRVRILRMRHVPIIDATGLHTLLQEAKYCRKQGIVLILSGVQKQLLKSMRQAGILNYVEEAHITPDIDAALAVAREAVSRKP